VLGGETRDHLHFQSTEHFVQESREPVLAFSDRGRNISLSSFGEEAEAVPGGDAVGKRKKLWIAGENQFPIEAKWAESRCGRSFIASVRASHYWVFLTGSQVCTANSGNQNVAAVLECVHCARSQDSILGGDSLGALPLSGRGPKNLQRASTPPARHRVDRLLEAEAEWCLRAETGELLDWWYGDGRGAHSHN
jgi:hypothetical protein